MLVCPLCDERAKFGVVVCRGCQAEIVYGATVAEKRASHAAGELLGLLLALVLFIFVTHLLWPLFFILPVVGHYLMGDRCCYHLGEVRYFRGFGRGH